VSGPRPAGFVLVTRSAGNCPSRRDEVGDERVVAGLGAVGHSELSVRVGQVNFSVCSVTQSLRAMSAFAAPPRYEAEDPLLAASAGVLAAVAPCTRRLRALDSAQVIHSLGDRLHPFPCLRHWLPAIRGRQMPSTVAEAAELSIGETHDIAGLNAPFVSESPQKKMPVPRRCR
jgi:hypothetical protein